MTPAVLLSPLFEMLHVFVLQTSPEPLHEDIMCALTRCIGSVGANPTRQLSLQPETPGADQEATNGLKHSGKSSLLGGSGPCGPQREQTLSRPRNEQCGSRPAILTGKADAAGEASETRTRRFHRGSGGSTHGREPVRNKGSLLRRPRPAAGGSTANPRGPAPAGADGGWVRSTRDAG